MPFPPRAAALSTVALAAAVAGVGAVPAAASAGVRANPAVAGVDYRAGEVVVRHARTAPGPTQEIVRVRGDVERAAARIARRPHVVSASPNWIARASFVPNDPGMPGGLPGGWAGVQWNFLGGPGGVDAPTAWDNLIAAGRPGGSGVIVAVLDTGVAYRDLGKRFKRSPDFTTRLRRGYDFVSHDHYALDQNGHGTHVASTIAEGTDNGVGLTGLAYGASIMPVRVLNSLGEGASGWISRGIRYAAKHKAKIINLSFEFSKKVTADKIPDILAAVRYAHRKGSLVIAASGNASVGALAYPARADDVLSVGAVTEHGCQADYSNSGPDLDISAPGGGPDARQPGDPNCRRGRPPGRDIMQLTFDRLRRPGVPNLRHFGYPDDYIGTSMAAPHVSATAALVVASGVLGPDPAPDAIEAHLKATADDLGVPGPDALYGAGKVNAGRATAPIAPVTPVTPPPPAR
jgi:serine protease